MSNLYNITQEYLDIASKLMELDGELTDELNEALAINKNDLETKATNYAYVILQAQMDSEIIDKEIERLMSAKARRTNMIARLKERVKNAMQIYGIDKVESPTLKLSLRKSEAVEVEDVEELDQNFVTVKVTKQPDKKAIKRAIEDGQEVKGAVIITNQNLQIK